MVPSGGGAHAGAGCGAADPLHRSHESQSSVNSPEEGWMYLTCFLKRFGEQICALDSNTEPFRGSSGQRTIQDSPTRFVMKPTGAFDAAFVIHLI